MLVRSKMCHLVAQGALTFFVSGPGDFALDPRVALGIA